MSIISFSHVAKQYAGGVSALSDVSMEIAEGELVYLAGPSGAGKSTFVRQITGVERPTRGEILFDGKPVDFATVRRCAIDSSASVVL